MTQQDYEQKKRECLDEFCKRYRIEEPSEQNIESFDWIFDRAYALGKQEKEMKEPGCGQTIKGWAACDRDGMLRLHYDKPERTDGGYWQGGFKSSYLPTAVVLPIVWESDPIEVDVIIKPHLTSDAEGEEMLMVSAITVREMYAANERIKTDAPDKELGRTSDHINHVLRCLFGSKCLPDDGDELSPEPKPAEPKFKLGDKAILKGYVCTITSRVYEQGKFVGYKIKSPQLHGNATVPESYLEPYTEPEEDKRFDNILKDGFSKERRLNIAAMAMQGLLNATSVERFTLRISPETIAEAAFEYADALINMNKKGVTP